MPILADRRGVRARRGVSLLEAVVAVAVVGITSVAALEAVGGDLRTTERARRAMEAEALAGSRLDFMDLMTDQELQSLPDSVSKGKFDKPLDEYSWTTTSTPVGEQAGVYDVRVKIDWGQSTYTVRSYQIPHAAAGDPMTARKGMTLMELVIALAITGLMATTGAAAFGAIIDHRRQIKDATVSTERAAALREMLRSWIYGGAVQFVQGGGPRGLTRAAPAGGRGAASSLGGMNAAAVTAAQASGDELAFTTQALNPSLLGNVRIRLYVDGDANTPEKGLTIEYQPNLQQPIVRKMLDSTIDTLHVEFLDMRTNRWYSASQVATITPRAVRLIMALGIAPLPPILSLPMLFPIGNQAQNSRAGGR